MAEYASRGVVRATLRNGKQAVDRTDVSAQGKVAALLADPHHDAFVQLVMANDAAELNTWLHAGGCPESLIVDGVHGEQGEYGGSALGFAAHLGQMVVLQELFKHEIHPEQRTGVWADAVVAASAAGQVETLTWLLQAGVKWAPRALSVAASAEVVNLLVDAGFDPEGKTTLRRGGDLKKPTRVSTMEKLLWRLRYLQAGPQRQRLIEAALALETRARKSILKKSAPFAEACAANVPDLVRAGLEAGADADPKPGRRGTPLMSAALSGDVVTMRVLLAAGARLDPDEIDRARSRGDNALADLLQRALGQDAF